MFLKDKRGQSTLEYALLIAAIVAGLVMMQIYVKRGFGGKMKGSADDVGEQYDPVAFHSNYNTIYGTQRQDTVTNRVSRSELTEIDTTNRVGVETVDAWVADEALTRAH